MKRSEINQRLDQLETLLEELNEGLTGYSDAHLGNLQRSLGLCRTGIRGIYGLRNQVRDYAPGTLFYSTNFGSKGFYGSVYCYSTADQVGTISIHKTREFPTISEAEAAVAVWLRENNHVAKPG